jgi:hypothetical protein
MGKRTAKEVKGRWNDGGLRQKRREGNIGGSVETLMDS